MGGFLLVAGSAVALAVFPAAPVAAGAKPPPVDRAAPERTERALFALG